MAIYRGIFSRDETPNVGGGSSSPDNAALVATAAKQLEQLLNTAITFANRSSSKQAGEVVDYLRQVHEACSTQPTNTPTPRLVK